LEFSDETTSLHTIENRIKNIFPDARIREISDSGILLMRVRIQTFGHFEVFVDGRPLHFEREKAKELMAYLIDRHGASVTTRQIAAVLWEDAEYDVDLKNRVTRIISSLRKTLNEAGVGALLIKEWNHLAIDTSQFVCDAYDFEQGDPRAVGLFRGEYMTNYSWAEVTTGTYVRMHQEKYSAET